MSEAIDLVVIGAGGHGREVADVARACALAGQPIRVLGYVDDDASLAGQTLCDLPVLGPLRWLANHARPGLAVVSGVGSPALRRRLVQRVAAWGVPFHRLVHPDAVLTPFITLGEGVVITAGCILTNEIELGDHVHLNRRATVGHDVRIGPFGLLAPGATLSGAVRLGEGCDVGTHACVLQNLEVGEWSIIGAGAVVHRPLPSNVTAVGVPARVIATREAGWHEGPPSQR